MTGQINGADKQLYKVLCSDYNFSMPDFQRPYTWGTEQASELLEDLLNAFQGNQSSYFLGTVVLGKSMNSPDALVIDGQQRLVTLTILIASIAKLVSADQTLRSDLERYLKEPGSPSIGLPPNYRVKLRTSDNSFFNYYVQDLNFTLPIFPIPRTESQMRIKDNSQLYIKELSNLFNGDVKKLFAFASYIVQYCYLVIVSTPQVNEAYKIFTIINNRGLALYPTDIIKANVLSKVNGNSTLYSGKWENMEKTATRDGFSELFGHIRMIFVKSKQQKTLIEEIDQYVIPRFPSADTFIDTCLAPYVSAYDVAKNAAHDDDNVSDLLRWLNRIDNSDWLPPALLFINKYGNDLINMRLFFRKLERLAAYMHICGITLNQRLLRYTVILKEIEQSDAAQPCPQSIELTQDEKNDMKAAFDKDIYGMTPMKRQYLLLRLDSFIAATGVTYLYEVITIEHVLPQTLDPTSQWAANWSPQQHERWVNKLANLVLLGRRRNSSAKNYDFDRKKNLYFCGTQGVPVFALTNQVNSMATWSPNDVQQRQSSLVDCLIQSWNL